jgi:hypothetical protein
MTRPTNLSALKWRESVSFIQCSLDPGIATGHSPQSHRASGSQFRWSSAVARILQGFFRRRCSEIKQTLRQISNPNEQPLPKSTGVVILPGAKYPTPSDSEICVQK